MRTHRRPAGAILVVLASLAFGCGHDSPGPGGATVRGNVSNAATAAVARHRSTYLAWLGETLLGFARTAYAQAPDTSLGGITVIVRGGGREVSDLTDASGAFVVGNAPTGDVVVLFRRGSCEAEVPLGGVLSNSTITLAGATFDCGTATVGAVGESFSGVLREDPDDPADVRLCVRRGDDDVERRVDMEGAAITGDSGNSIRFSALDFHDLVEISGSRSGAGETFTFDTASVHVARHEVRDDCLNPL